MNRYLVSKRGAHLGSRVRPGLLLIGPLLGAPSLVALVGNLIDVDSPFAWVVVVTLVASVFAFFGGIILAWIFLLQARPQLDRAMAAAQQGDTSSAVALCHPTLGRVFRSDMRTRAFYILGQCAEANGDFVESADLFSRTLGMIPALAAANHQRRARCLALCHRAIAYVAIKNIEAADADVRNASLLFPPVAPGAFDFLTNSPGVGQLGVAQAMSLLEAGRDPRALLTLASALVLAARGMNREALELVDRERVALGMGIHAPREKALLHSIENRARTGLFGGPMRSPAMVHVGPPDPWAERVLPHV